MKQLREDSTSFLTLLRDVNCFAVPLMLTGVLQLLYNAADTAVVGKFAGSVCLAAVGNTTHIIHLLITMFNGVAVGVNYLVARYYGAGEEEGLHQSVHCAAVLSLILGLCAGALGLVLCEPLLRLVQVPDNVLPLSVLYLRIYFLGIPALIVYNFGAAILRSVGDTRYPLLFMVLSGALNVGLNLLLVVVFHLDVAGVAIATSVSQLFSAVLVTLRLCTIQNPCRLHLRQLRLYPDKALTMLRVGLSAGIQGMVFSVANVTIQAQINSFGDAAMAGSTAAANIENFIHTAQNAYYQAAITFTSQALGGGKPRRVFPIFWACIGSGTALGLALCACAQIFQVPLLTIFIKKDDPAFLAVLAAGSIRVMGIGRFQWVGGLMETACGSIRGLGKTVNPTVTTLLGSCALRMVWVYTVFALSPTLQTLYLSYPVSWLLTFAVHIFFLLLWRREAYSAETSKEVPSV